MVRRRTCLNDNDYICDPCRYSKQLEQVQKQEQVMVAPAPRMSLERDAQTRNNTNAILGDGSVDGADRAGRGGGG